MKASPLPFTGSVKQSFICHSIALLALLVAPISASAMPLPHQMELRESEDYSTENFIQEIKADSSFCKAGNGPTIVFQ